MPGSGAALHHAAHPDGVCAVLDLAEPGRMKVDVLTLEDETGTVNLIVWPSLLEQQRKEVPGAPLLGVYGVWQQEGLVRNLVARRLVGMSHLLGLSTSRCDFC